MRYSFLHPIHHDFDVAAEFEFQEPCRFRKIVNAGLRLLHPIKEFSTHRPSERVTGICFCGYLLYYLAIKHCFADGNKRVAWSSAMWVLECMGLTVAAPDQDVIDYVLAIADGKVESGEDVVNWLADRLAEIE